MIVKYNSFISKIDVSSNLFIVFSYLLPWKHENTIFSLLEGKPCESFICILYDQLKNIHAKEQRMQWKARILACIDERIKRYKGQNGGELTDTSVSYNLADVHKVSFLKPNKHLQLCM